MNDKQQLAAIAQQLAAMGEHLAEQQPLCLAKRVEELEAQCSVMADLLREALPYVKDCSDWGRGTDICLLDAISAVISMEAK